MSGRVPLVTFRPEPPSPSQGRLVGARRKDRSPGSGESAVARASSAGSGAGRPPGTPAHGSGGSPARAVLRAVGRSHRGGTTASRAAPVETRVAAAVTSRGPLGGPTGITGHRPGHGHEAVVQGAPASWHPRPGQARPRCARVRRGHSGSVSAASPKAPRHLTPPRPAPVRHLCPRCAPGPRAERSTANPSRSIAMRKPCGRASTVTSRAAVGGGTDIPDGRCEVPCPTPPAATYRPHREDGSGPASSHGRTVRPLRLPVTW